MSSALKPVTTVAWITAGLAAAVFVILPILKLVLGGTPAAAWQAVWHLGTGWFRHPLVNLPHLNWNIPTLALSTAALAAAGVLARRLASDLCGRPITWRPFLAAGGIIIGTTAAAIAMTGIVHEFAWLARSPVLVTNRSSRTEAINHGKQLYLILIDLASEGIHPGTVEEVRRHVPEAAGMTVFAPSVSPGASERFVLLSPGKNLLELDPSTPVVAGFQVEPGRSLVVTADGHARIVGQDELESLLETALP